MNTPATYIDAVRSEWTKLTSLWSSWWTLLATAVLGVGIGALVSADSANTYRIAAAADRASFDPTHESLFTGVIFATLAMVVLGVLVVTSEYATGMIRTSLVAVPRRRRLLAAKVTVLLLVGLVTSVPIGFGMFLAGQAILAGSDVPHATLDQPQVLRAVFGAGLFLTAAALMGLAVGVIVRSTAGAIAFLFTTTLLVPTAILPSLPDQLGDPLLKYWPNAAGMAILSTRPVPETLTPWTGLGWMWLATIAVLAAAFLVFRAKDA